jgi:hypothetical protein
MVLESNAYGCYTVVTLLLTQPVSKGARWMVTILASKKEHKSPNLLNIIKSLTILNVTAIRLLLILVCG